MPSPFFEAYSKPMWSRAFKNFYMRLEKSSLDEQLSLYGAFSRALYERGGNLTEFVKTFIIEDENFFLIKRLNNAIISRSIYECLDEELLVLQN